MFQRVHQANALIHFLRERLPPYATLVRQDAQEFRREIVTATVGVGIAAVAALLFACFASLAVIVSAWDGRYRILCAWAVVSLWGVIAIGGGLVARSALLRRPAPFRHVSAALSRDYAQLVVTVEKEQ